MTFWHSLALYPSPGTESKGRRWGGIHVEDFIVFWCVLLQHLSLPLLSSTSYHILSLPLPSYLPSSYLSLHPCFPFISHHLIFLLLPFFYLSTSCLFLSPCLSFHFPPFYLLPSTSNHLIYASVLPFLPLPIIYFSILAFLFPIISSTSFSSLPSFYFVSFYLFSTTHELFFCLPSFLSSTLPPSLPSFLIPPLHIS